MGRVLLGRELTGRSAATVKDKQPRPLERTEGDFDPPFPQGSEIRHEPGRHQDAQQQKQQRHLRRYPPRVPAYARPPQHGASRRCFTLSVTLMSAPAVKKAADAIPASGAPARPDRRWKGCGPP